MFPNSLVTGTDEYCTGLYISRSSSTRSRRWHRTVASRKWPVPTVGHNFPNGSIIQHIAKGLFSLDHSTRMTVSTMTKQLIFFLVALLALTLEGNAFSFSNMVSIARPAFLRNKQSSTTPVTSVSTNEQSKQSSSLQEFNALCQEAIEDERRLHYNAYLAEACRNNRMS